MNLGRAELVTRRLRLRPLSEDDVDGLHAVFSDAESMRYWSDPPTQSPEETLARIQADLDLIQQGHSMVWAVLPRNGATAWGKCILFQFNRQNRRAEIGFILNRAHWRQGLMFEACSELVRHAFEDLGLHRLEADVDADNAGSMALLEKLGFEREGYFPERWCVFGEWQDSVMFGLLQPRWLERREPD